MSDPATVDSIWQIVGTAFAMGVTGAVGWWASDAKAKRNQVTAEATAAATVADANSTVYNKLIARLTAAEEDILRLHHELAAVRRQFRHAEDHIALLQRTMRGAGMSPPEYVALAIDPIDRRQG